MITRRRILASTATLAALPAFGTSGAPDIVLLNGEIHTVDANNSRIEALAISGGKVIATGTSHDIRTLAGSNTRIIDLDGRTVLPGINDSHLHMLGWGMSRPPFAVDVTYPGVQSISDCLERVRAAVAQRQPGEWIIGRGWDQPYFAEGRAPTAADLDKVAPNNPVALTEFSGHAVWTNTRAMEIAGINPTSTAPPGGVIVRDDEGRATGLFFEGAMTLIFQHMPPPTREFRVAALEGAMEHLLSRGITSITEPGLDPPELAIVKSVALKHRKLRITGLVRAGGVEQALNASTETLGRALRGLSLLDLPEPQWMQIPGVKIMGDGIPTGNKTAWLHTPYVGGGNGSLTIAGDNDEERVVELNNIITMVHDAGLQVATHVTGDRAIDTVVAAYARVQMANPRPDPRHYLIHADLVSPGTLKRMANLGVGANFNPEIKYLIADSQMASIGPQRANYEWPYRTAIDTGVNVASASDAPVTEGNWLQGIATCMERKGKQTGNVSGPEQRITLDDAIRTYTQAGAWQDRADSWKGTLEPGKVADICVVDERLSSVEPSVFANAEVKMTLVGGQIVHEA